MTEKHWFDFSHKELSYYDKATGRNVVGAREWQMPYIEKATASRDKTTKKYKKTVRDFLLTQNDRIINRFNDYFGLKKEIGINDVDVVLSFLIPDIENEIIVRELTPMHTSCIQKGVEDINVLAGATVNSQLTNAQLAMNLSVIANKVTRVNDGTRYLLRNIILKGIANDEGVNAIKDRIKDAGINEYYQGRALTIARTETRIAYDAGGQVAYKELGATKFDVVGCVGTLAGTNSLGLSASYGDFSETVGSCGVLGVDMNMWDAVSGLHHVSHNGCQVSSEIPL